MPGMATFQIKNFTSIAASMMQRMGAATKKVTDFNIGSVVRTMLEAVAAELDELYQQLFNGVTQAIPVATYNTFNFPALSAGAASGQIGVNITAQTTGTLIAVGTVFTSLGAGTSYASANDVTIPAGQTAASVLSVAQKVGVIGNIPSGLNFTPNPAITGFVSASNAAAFTDGQDAETEAQHQQRFNEYILSLARCTPAALSYGAGTSQVITNGVVTEQVKYSNPVEAWKISDANPYGLVFVYVHNGTGSTSSQLVSQCSSILYGYVDTNGNKVPGYKAAGVNLTVFAATDTPLDVSGTFVLAPGFDSDDVQAAIEAAISTYIYSIPIEGVFQYTKYIYLARAVPGVANFSPTSPLSDQVSTYSQKFLPGDINITLGS